MLFLWEINLGVTAHEFGSSLLLPAWYLFSSWYVYSYCPKKQLAIPHFQSGKQIKHHLVSKISLILAEG